MVSKPSILFVSTGRTGTVSIAETFLRYYPDIKSAHEPFGSRALRIIGNLYASDRIKFATAAVAIRTTHGLRRRLRGNRILIESNPHLSCLIPIISNLYPETVIIHVVRHPIDFVRSYINHGAFNGIKGFMGNRIPFWFLRPEHVGHSIWPPWNKMNPVEASAWRWSIHNRIIENDCVKFTNVHTLVRYEDLFQENSQEWSRIASVCGLDTSSRDIHEKPAHANASRRSIANMSDESVQELKELLRNRCNDQLKRYGYEL